MPTSLKKVRELNYDHHRRMTELHNSRVATGDNEGIASVDEQSYRTLLAFVMKNRSNVLELGSASGGQWDLLREWCPEGRITGIDLFEPAVLAARERGLPIEVGFVEDMGMFADSTFDLVCSRHVMEHLGDVDQGIREILRVTKRGGYVAHVTPDMEYDNEPAHLNKWKVNQWAEKWREFGVMILHSAKYPYHGGEVHIVCQKING